LIFFLLSSKIGEIFCTLAKLQGRMTSRTVLLTLWIGLVTLTSLVMWRTHNTLRRLEGLHRGDSMPLARVRTPAGRFIETGSWLGTPTLLIVFNPECRPCQEEIGNLASIAPRFPHLKIALLSTKTDIGELSAPFPVYVDFNGGFLPRVQRLVTPAIYWIGASGKVLYARIGKRDAADEERLFRRLQAEDK
jgi:hypothetical protein